MLPFLLNGPLLRDRPEQVGLSPWGGKGDETKENSFPPKRIGYLEILKQGQFSLGISYFLISYGSYALLDFIVTYGVLELNIPYGTASLFITVTAFCGIPGGILIMMLSDHIGTKKSSWDHLYVDGLEHSVYNLRKQCPAPHGWNRMVWGPLWRGFSVGCSLRKGLFLERGNRNHSWASDDFLRSRCDDDSSHHGLFGRSDRDFSLAFWAGGLHCIDCGPLSIRLISAREVSGNARRLKEFFYL